MTSYLKLTDAFGKLESATAWHPLVDHMADVAAVFEQLCSCTAIKRMLENAARRAIQDTDIARLSAIAFLHDLGKANAGFQAKRWTDQERPHNWLKAGHTLEALALLEAACASEGEVNRPGF